MLNISEKKTEKVDKESEFSKKLCYEAFLCQNTSGKRANTTFCSKKLTI